MPDPVFRCRAIGASGLFSALATVVGLGGCNSAAWRKPIRPEVALPSAFTEASASVAGPSGATSAVAPDETWWTVFADPRLNELVVLALAHNADLAGVEARLAEARASLRAADATLWPSLGLGPSAQRLRNSEENARLYDVHGSAVPAGGLELSEQRYINRFGLEATVSYEVDLFGRLRNSREAATTDFAASAADLRGARLSLAAQVASAWYQFVATARQTELAGQGAAFAGGALAQQATRVRNGLAPADSLVGLEQAAADARAEAARLNAASARLRHALVVLCGRPADQLALDHTGVRLPDAPIIPAGVPSDVLRRRPDIAAAEAQLAAAQARVGAAKAAFFPQISLTGSFGTQSEALENLLMGDAIAWSVAGLITHPLFDGGRNRASLEAAQSDLDAAVAFYRQRVFESLREVDDALSDSRELDAQARAAAQASAAAARAVSTAADRFRLGLAGKAYLLTARQAALARERAEISLHADRLAATIALVQALGGGWTEPS